MLSSNSGTGRFFAGKQAKNQMVSPAHMDSGLLRKSSRAWYGFVRLLGKAEKNQRYEGTQELESQSKLLSQSKLFWLFAHKCAG